MYVCALNSRYLFCIFFFYRNFEKVKERFLQLYKRLSDSDDSYDDTISNAVKKVIIIIMIVILCVSLIMSETITFYISYPCIFLKKTQY